VGPRAGLSVLEKQKISCLLPDFEPHTLQPVASHCNDYTILALLIVINICIVSDVTLCSFVCELEFSITVTER
jgi:hypothetical protein